MFCPTCGKPHGDEAKFCPSCGIAIIVKSTLPTIQPEQTAKPTPIALIATAWILIIFSFFPMGQVGILISLAILIGAIFLISSKNDVGKTNGWIILAIWAITFLYGFFTTFTKTIMER